MRLKQYFIILYFFIINLIAMNLSYAALHDPTEPPISPITLVIPGAPEAESNYKLQSILIGPSRRLAMINGQIVGTGSSIQGARVLAIDKNHVVLFYAGRKKILYLFGRRLWKAH